MSTIERDLAMWADGELAEHDVLERHGDEARELMELHALFLGVEVPDLPDFATIAAGFEPRPVGLVSRMRIRAQRPIAVALGSVLMTGGAAYATVPPVRDAINNAVEKVGEAMGIVESNPAGDLTPDSDDVVPGERSRLNDDPNAEGVGEQGMGRGPQGNGKSEGKRKDGKAASGEHRRDGERRSDRSEKGTVNASGKGQTNSGTGAAESPGAQGTNEENPEIPDTSAGVSEHSGGKPD